MNDEGFTTTRVVGGFHFTVYFLSSEVQVQATVESKRDYGSVEQVVHKHSTGDTGLSVSQDGGFVTARILHGAAEQLYISLTLHFSEALDRRTPRVRRS